MIISNQGTSIFLRQSIPEDTPILQRAYTDESFIHLYRSNNPLQSEEQLRQILIERQKHSPEEMGYIEFVIVHRRYGTIGVATLGDYSTIHQRAEFLIGLFNEKHRCGRYALEASLLILDLAFNAYNFNKLYTYVYEYNDFAEKSTISLGFTHEGTLKNHHYLIHDKKFVSLYVNGLVVDDFRHNEKLRQLSLKFLGRDITRPYEEISAVPAEQALASQYVPKLLEKLRTLSIDHQKPGVEA